MMQNMSKEVNKQTSITNLIQNRQINVLKPFEQDFNQNTEHTCTSIRKPYLNILADSHGRSINELLSKYLETDY